MLTILIIASFGYSTSLLDIPEAVLSSHFDSFVSRREFVHTSRTCKEARERWGKIYIHKIVTVSGRTAKLWNALNGELIRTFEGHDWVKSAEFSKGGDKILTCSHVHTDDTAKLWNAETGELIHTFEVPLLFSAAFSEYGDKIFTKSYLGVRTEVTVWNPATWEVIHTFAEDAWFRSVTLSNDGRYVLITPEYGHEVQLWSLETKELIHTFKGHTNYVRRFVFSREGNKILTASHDRTAKIWNVETGELIRTFTGHTGWVLSAVFSKAGNEIVTTSDDRTAKIWNAETGELIRTFEHSGIVDSADSIISVIEIVPPLRQSIETHSSNLQIAFRIFSRVFQFCSRRANRLS